MQTITPMEARCNVCGDTGSKSQDIDGFQDCTACDAVERRAELLNYLSSLSPLMSPGCKAWAAYNFGMLRPVAAQPSEAAQQEPIGYVSISALSALVEYTKQGMPNSIRMYNDVQPGRVELPVYAAAPTAAGKEKA